MTNTWHIKKLICKSSEGLLTNVVQSVLWKYEKSDGTNTVFEDGFCTLGEHDPNSFTPYTQLTKEQVVSWIQLTMGNAKLTDLDARLLARLNLKNNIVPLDPPFTN